MVHDHLNGGAHDDRENNPGGHVIDRNARGDALSQAHPAEKSDSGTSEMAPRLALSPTLSEM
jgi:hypothetical protein